MYYYPQGGSMTPGYMSQQQVNNFGIKGRPVSSIEEVRAAQIDFDGSLFIFPDIAHNRIYTKQISLDGTASLNMYELAAVPAQVPVDASNYITREEFNEALAKLQSATQPDKKDTEAPAAAYKF